MGSLLFLLFPWGIILQALAIVHFIRRRPDTYWLWIIIFFGPIGALIYIAVEVIPDAGLLRQSFKVFPRRRRIHELEAAILDNPSAGNYEELADLYLEEGNYARARQCYDKAISSRTDSPDPFYRRGITELQMGDFAAALVDLERVVSSDSKYDFHRAVGLLAHAYANAGQPDKAESLFQQATKISTLSETYYNYATFLASQQRYAEAREWTQRILAKKPTMPGYLRRRERPWFRRASGLLKRLPA
ncbi:MAG: tetratricopeptide repeat protein [Acidobacteriia bacterium]|nr:tetratricopeptide repeat protein [Terriglobia bacterium]